MSLQVERFEDRLLLATFLVNDTADTVSGAGTTGTLRYVLGQLSALNQPTNEIDFQLGGTGAQTITLGSDLPSIANPVTVDGYKLNGPANTAAVGKQRRLDPRAARPRRPRRPGVRHRLVKQRGERPVDLQRFGCRDHGSG